MNLTTLLVLVAAAASPRVDISTLSGEEFSGHLKSINGETWKLDVDGKAVDVASSQILKTRFFVAGKSGDAESMQVTLTDGTSLSMKAVKADSKQVKVESATTGSMEVPRTVVKSLRYAASPTSVDESWNELLIRDARKDMIVVRKKNADNDVLDFVEGVIGEINETHIKVLIEDPDLDESVEVKVPVERVFGLIFYQKDGGKPRPSVRVELQNGGLLKARSVSSAEGNELALTLAVGPEISLPADQIKSVDFSSGRLAWLDAMTPREKRHEFQIIDVVPEFRTNRDIYGSRLKVGKRSFDRGLCIRSKTTVRYRLDGDFSRYQTWIGIQDGYAGDVTVTVKCDGTELFSGAVEPDKEAQRLDLNVTDKYSLEITVDFGKVESDIGDHLVMGDARLLK